MRLTKYTHSCLLAEENGVTVLFDPGEYTWQSSSFPLDEIAALDFVVITHEHPDHFCEPFVLALIEKFPELQFVASPPVVQKLKELRIPKATSDSIGSLQVFSTKRHASMEPLAPPPPENIAVHFADKLTVGGDRHDLEETKDILALPIIAPWGSVKQGAEMVLRLKPKYILPIHDWHWNDVARQAEYDRSASVYQNYDIMFLKPTDGKPMEVR